MSLVSNITVKYSITNYKDLLLDFLTICQSLRLKFNALKSQVDD